MQRFSAFQSLQCSTFLPNTTRVYLFSTYTNSDFTATATSNKSLSHHADKQALEPTRNKTLFCKVKNAVLQK